jgi:hypothetical protein
MASFNELLTEVISNFKESNKSIVNQINNNQTIFIEKIMELSNTFQSQNKELSHKISLQDNLISDLEDKLKNNTFDESNFNNVSIIKNQSKQIKELQLRVKEYESKNSFLLKQKDELTSKIMNLENNDNLNVETLSQSTISTEDETTEDESNINKGKGRGRGRGRGRGAKTTSRGRGKGRGKKTAEEPEQVVEEPEQVVEEPEQVVEEPEHVVEEPEQVVEEPEQVVEKPEQVVEEPEQVVEEPEQVVEEPEQVVEEPEQVVEEPDNKLHPSDFKIIEYKNTKYYIKTEEDSDGKKKKFAYEFLDTLDENGFNNVGRYMGKYIKKNGEYKVKYEK